LDYQDFLWEFPFFLLNDEELLWINNNWTAKNIPDLTGRVIIVIGAKQW
jgi:hypothetical protein